MYPAVQKVHANDDFTLAITFDDGVVGLLDMKPYLDFGVFGRLKDLDVFSRVHVAFDTIEWNCGVDLDPEFVRSKLVINTQSGKAA
ncbi:TPA: DUF2442 domain-containing protein [Candidatus Sumerlaeota bacterium]|jgi:hypothetical protein|nr:DUF2442 domain-containing protein [Candidatus Sumerlaeota bacterium]